MLHLSINKLLLLLSSSSSSSSSLNTRLLEQHINTQKKRYKVIFPVFPEGSEHIKISLSHSSVLILQSDVKENSFLPHDFWVSPFLRESGDYSNFWSENLVKNLSRIMSSQNTLFSFIWNCFHHPCHHIESPFQFHVASRLFR